jgi:hypothetical protein
MSCLSSLGRWDRGIESQSRHGCLCVRLFCVCVALCLGRGLATGWSLVQGVPPSVKQWLRNWRRGQGPTKGCRVIVEWMNEFWELSPWRRVFLGKFAVISADRTFPSFYNAMDHYRVQRIHSVDPVFIKLNSVRPNETVSCHLCLDLKRVARNK